MWNGLILAIKELRNEEKKEIFLYLHSQVEIILIEIRVIM